MDAARRIFEHCAEVAPSLKDSGATKILKHQVGLRPAREGGARVEAEVVKFPLDSTHSLVPWDAVGLENGSMRVVHAYGFGWGLGGCNKKIALANSFRYRAGGYQASWGVAAEVLALIKGMNTTT